jgi:hypothetical protein
VWALSEGVDRRVFRNEYSDIAFLGKVVTRGRGWRGAGYAWHVANGALFGVAFDAVRRRTTLPPRRLAIALALAENTTLYPLTLISDRRHPARGDEDVAPLWSLRAFAQATWRHTLFGWIVGSLVTSPRRSG